jgi:hypothetical protein
VHGRESVPVLSTGYVKVSDLRMCGQVRTAAAARSADSGEQVSDSSRAWEEDKRRENEEAEMHFIPEEIERCEQSQVLCLKTHS